MIVLKATRRFSGYTYSVSRDGEVVCSASDEQVVVASLLQLGVEKPEPLIAAARKWGVVEIHDDASKSK